MKKRKRGKVVQSTWIVKLAPQAKIQVRKGQKIKAGEVLAVLARRKTKKIFFPPWLKASKGVWSRGGLRQKGDKIAKGDLLYEKKGFLGTAKRWLSPEGGKIMAIQEEEGFLKIVTGLKEKKLFSPVAGKVVAVSPQKIEIVFSAYQFTGQAAGRGRAWGKLKVLSGDSPFTAVNCQCRGQILLVKEADFSLLKKSFALGAKGVVTFSFPEANLIKTLPCLPVLLLERERAAELAELEGNPCFLDLSTQQLLICCH